MIERSASFSSESPSESWPSQSDSQFFHAAPQVFSASTDLTELAKQRNAEAMAGLLTQKLQSHGITARVLFQPTGLEVLLEAAQIPDQSFAVAAILSEVVRLQIPALERVQLWARQQGTQIVWTQAFELLPSHSPPAHQDSDLASASLNTLRSRVSLGDLQAMTALIDRAFAHKNMTAQVHLEPTCLQIDLTCPPLAERSTCVTLVCREMMHWQLPIASEGLIRIRATQNHTRSLWSKEIRFSTVAERDQLLHQYSLGQSTRSSVNLSAPRRQLAQRVDDVTWKDATLWKIGATSLLLAGLLISSERLTFLMSPFLTIVHELGHAASAWLFGYAALPAFDFLYGGGVTMQTTDRIPLLLFGLFSGFAYLCYRYRHRDGTSRLLLGVAVAYCICAFTGLHSALIVAMGHGFELLFAGIFLYRALSGWSCRYSIERPLYGMLGLFTVFYNLRFSYQLLTQAKARLIYEAGKGSILDHDFVRLANDYLHVDLAVVVAGFLLCNLVTPLVVFLLFRYRLFLLYWFYRAFL
jgi:hypothetical protein